LRLPDGPGNIQTVQRRRSRQRAYVLQGLQTVKKILLFLLICGVCYGLFGIMTTANIALILIVGFIFFKIRKNKRKKTLKKSPSSYVVIDLETTGLSPSKNEIIELAAIKVINDEITDKFSSLCKPKRKITPHITNINGITNDMAADAPNIEEIIPKYVEFIGELPVVGHNVEFDLKFINSNADKYLRNEQIDTLRFARGLYPDIGAYNLRAVSNYLNIQHGNLHRAINDCEVTNEIYQKIKPFITRNVS
jgi:DNA polymerase III epsilon subunit family exonuclease